MITILTFIRSLLLASVLSFAAPLLFIGSVLVGLDLLAHIPHVATLSQATASQILGFLATFGSGDAIEGTFVIAVVFSLVGALFDTYAFYRHQL